jgi:hypothetical protein
LEKAENGLAAPPLLSVLVCYHSISFALENRMAVVFVENVTELAL